MNWKKIFVGIVAVLLLVLQVFDMVLERGVCQEEGRSGQQLQQLITRK